MKLKNVATAGVIALAAAIALSSCSSNGTTPSGSTSTELKGTITTGGSSAQANAQTAWTAAFQAQHSGVTINYDKSQGSGGGVTNFLSGSYDFAGSDAALTADQESQAKALCSGPALNIPVYLSGVDIVYNLPGVTKLNLDAETIAKIFAKKITMWNDKAIAALNKGVSLPAQKITQVVRADGSGTTANFTTYLSQTAKDVWTYPVSTAWPVTGESGQQGGSGIVSTVQSGKYTIGYVDQSSVADGMTAANIEVGTSGNFVAYSSAGATAAFTAAATTASQGTGDLTQNLDYTKISDASAYPIPLLSYDILCSKFKSSKQANLVKAYVGFIGSSTGQAVGEKNAKSAPLPASILGDIKTSLAAVK